MKEIISEPKVIIGVCLLVTGWVFALLMVIHIIEPTFFLCFFSYAASNAGLLLSVIGTALEVAYLRKKQRK